VDKERGKINHNIILKWSRKNEKMVTPMGKSIYIFRGI
jgi:hypothetical protein